jgi:Pyridoxamine 5'-phosphate oxidase
MATCPGAADGDVCGTTCSMKEHLVPSLIVNAIISPTEENLTLLRPVLAIDVRAAGPFLNAHDAESLLAAIAAEPAPALAQASYGEPTVDGDEVVVRGELPPGMQIAAVQLVLRLQNGLVHEFFQEVEMAGRPPAAPMIIDDSIRSVIDSAFSLGLPFVVSYVDADAHPHASFRGTVQSHGIDTIALWVRDRNGGLLRSLATNPNVVLLYREPTSRTYYEITGRAYEVDSAVERQRIFGRCPDFERRLDPAMRGAAVVIDVDSLLGGPPTQAVHLKRDA